MAESIGAPGTSFGATASSMACMIAGTPAITMTLPIQKPGALEIGFSTSSAPTGMRAMRAAGGVEVLRPDPLQQQCYRTRIFKDRRVERLRHARRR